LCPARALCAETDLIEKIEETFTTLLEQEEAYLSRGSGFILETVDGVMLTVYRYTPMVDSSYVQHPVINYDGNNDDKNDGDNNTSENINDNNNDSENYEDYNYNNEGEINIDNLQNNDQQILNNIIAFAPKIGSSYIPLPAMIENKNATINPHNNDRQYFKWCVLTKHVTGRNKYCVTYNYYKHEHKYNFAGLSFPTPLSHVKIFERNNQNISINIYGIEKKI